jgi:nucleoside-diphosphate-sugar epimerase
MLLLTGATGLVGSAWLTHLLRSNPDRPVAVLLRRDGQPQRDGVLSFKGDISLPRLGLSDCTYRDLQLAVEDIVHCAADTRFGLPLDEARATNTTGTHHVLDFAYACPRLRRVAHLSTVYAAGRSTGTFTEDPFSGSHGFFNTYQQSKFEAEQLVVRAMDDLPIAIYRLSSLIGDSATGRVRQFNYVHQLLRCLPRNVLPMIPGDPSAPVDLIPSDWAVQALNRLFEASFVAGRIYHVCAGPRHSFTVGEMMEQTVRTFEDHPAMRRFLPLNVPRLVSLPEYEAYVAEQQRGRDGLLKELLRVLGLFLPQLGVFQAFENQHARAGLDGYMLNLPEMSDTYCKVIRYCIDTNWGREPLPRPTALQS